MRTKSCYVDEWKLIRYPEMDYKQLFNQKNDPLEINDLADVSPSKVKEMMELLKQWQTKVDDIASLATNKILPMEYVTTKFKQKADVNQPKYFKGVKID